MKKHLFWILFFLVCLICALTLFDVKRGNIATVKSNGEVLYNINLDTVSEPYEITVDYNGHFNTIKIEKESISVISADCPDKLCMKQNSDLGVPIVCLPNKLSISFENSEYDAVS